MCVVSFPETLGAAAKVSLLFVWEFFSFYLLFSLTIHPDLILPPHSPQPSPLIYPLSLTHCPSGSFQKRTGFLGISTEHGITRCHKTRCITLLSRLNEATQ